MRKKESFVWVLYNVDDEEGDNDVMSIHRTKEGAMQAGINEVNVINEDNPEEKPIPIEWKEEDGRLYIETGDYQALEVGKWILFD